MVPFAVYNSAIFFVPLNEENFWMIFSENVETHISGKPSIFFVVSQGLNKAGSEIFVRRNIVFKSFTSYC